MPKPVQNRSESLCAGSWVPCRIFWAWFGPALGPNPVRNCRFPAGSLEVFGALLAQPSCKSLAADHFSSCFRGVQSGSWGASRGALPVGLRGLAHALRLQATAMITRILAICKQGLGRSQKSFIFAVLTGPIDLQTLPKRWRAKPSIFLEAFGGRSGPFRPQI